MKSIFTTGLLSLILSSLQAQVQDSVTVRFEVQVPESTPIHDPIFIASSENIWDPGNMGTGFGGKDYSIQSVPDGESELFTLTFPVGTILNYKYTRGSIFSVEETAEFAYREVRKVVFDHNKTIVDSVAAWRDLPSEEIGKNWPILTLFDSDINLFRMGRDMNYSGTIAYDFEMGKTFYDVPSTTDLSFELSAEYSDTLLYFVPKWNFDHKIILVSALKTTPTANWDIYIDLNNDFTISDQEFVFAMTDSVGANRFDGFTYFLNKESESLSIDSLAIQFYQVDNLPPGYSSSYRKDDPDFIYTLPYEKKFTTIGKDTLYIINRTETSYTDFFWAAVDYDKSNSIEFSSNEDFEIHFSEMKNSDTYFLYPSFKLGENSWDVVSIDPDGEWIRLKPHAGKEIAVQNTVVPGKPTPLWEASLVTGESISSSELNGKYVLLDFWGSWCGPCIQEIPELKEVTELFNSENFVMIGFAYEGETSLKKTMQEYEIDWPQIVDEAGEYSKLFNVSGYPTKFLIDPEGVIVEYGYSLRGESLMEILQSYLSE